MTKVTQPLHTQTQCLERPCSSTRITTAALGALLLVAGIALLAATSGSYFYLGITCSVLSLIPFGISCIMKSAAEEPTDVQHEQPETLTAPEALKKAPSLLDTPRQALEVMQKVVYWPDDQLKEKDTLLLSIADAFLKTNDKAGAREAINFIYGSCPGKEPLLVKLARAHLDQDELDNALDVASQIFRLKEEKHTLQSDIVDAWLKKGDLNKAREVVNGIDDVNLRTPLQLQLILAFLNQPDLQKAQDQMQCVHFIPDGSEPQLLEIAQAFFDQEKYANVLHALDLISGENATKEALLWKLIQAYFDRGSEQEVQRTILCAKKSHLELRLHFARAYLEAGKKEQSLKLIHSEKGEQRDALILEIAKAHAKDGDEAAALLTLRYLAFDSPLNRDFLTEMLQCALQALEEGRLKRILRSLITHVMTEKITQNIAYSTVLSKSYSLPEAQQQKIGSSREELISRLAEKTYKDFTKKLKKKGAEKALEWIKTEVTQQKHILNYLAKSN